MKNHVLCTWIIIFAVRASLFNLFYWGWKSGRVFYYAWNWQSEGQYNLPETIRYYLFEDGIKAFVANQGQHPTDSDGAALPEKIAQIPTIEEGEGKDSFEYDGTQKEPALVDDNVGYTLSNQLDGKAPGIYKIYQDGERQ